MLGYAPDYPACEGRSWRPRRHCANGKRCRPARGGIIGAIEPGHRHVVPETELGGERLLQELEDDPLPRIC